MSCQASWGWAAASGDTVTQALGVVALEALALGALTHATVWTLDAARVLARGKAGEARAPSAAPSLLRLLRPRPAPRFGAFCALPQDMQLRVASFLDLATLSRVESASSGLRAAVRAHGREAWLRALHEWSGGSGAKPLALALARPARLRREVLAGMAAYAESELGFYRRRQALLCAQSDFGSDAVVLPSQIGAFESAAVARAVRLPARLSSVVFVRRNKDAESLRRGAGKHGFSGQFVSIATGASFAAAASASRPATRRHCPGFLGEAIDLVRLAPEHEEFRPCFSMLFRTLEVWASASARQRAVAQGEADADTSAVFVDAEAPNAALDPDELLDDATTGHEPMLAALLWGDRRRRRFVSRWQVEEFISALAAEALALRRSLAAVERDMEDEGEDADDATERSRSTTFSSNTVIP
jgi:hypothetical protein